LTTEKLLRLNASGVQAGQGCQGPKIALAAEATTQAVAGHRQGAQQGARSCAPPAVRSRCAVRSHRSSTARPAGAHPQSARPGSPVLRISLTVA
jgi:hypothetical protein